MYFHQAPPLPRSQNLHLQFIEMWVPLAQDIPGAAFELLHIHVIPTKPHHCRVMVHFYMGGATLPLKLKVLPKLVPAWYGHLQGLEITDGDNTFLIAQVCPPLPASCLAL